MCEQWDRGCLGDVPLDRVRSLLCNVADHNGAAMVVVGSSGKYGVTYTQYSRRRADW